MKVVERGGGKLHKLVHVSHTRYTVHGAVYFTPGYCDFNRHLPNLPRNLWLVSGRLLHLPMGGIRADKQFPSSDARQEAFPVFHLP